MKKNKILYLLFFMFLFLNIFSTNIFAANSVNIYSSSKTDSSGKNIYITFIKDIKNESIKKEDFSVKIGNNNATITDVSMLSESSKIIKIKISDSITSSNTIKVSYPESGSLKDVDGVSVASFEKTVTNYYGKGAKYSSSSVQSEGNKIIIKFTKDLDSKSVDTLNGIINNISLNTDSLYVTVNGKNQQISRISLDNKRELTIYFASYLTGESNTLYISYEGAILSGTDGSPIENFSNKSISYSTVSPKITNATVSVEQDKIILIFNTGINQDSLINVINNEQLTIKPSSSKDITFTGEVSSNDQKKVYLNLSDELKKSETVKITYKTGSNELLSLSGKSISSFTKTASKASSNNAPELDSINLNKDGDKLTLKFKQEISSIESSDDNYGFEIKGTRNKDTTDYDVKSYEISGKNLYLYLDSDVDAKETIKVKFNNSDTYIYGINESYVKSFSFKTVDNKVQTDDFILKEVYTDTNGQYIYLLFNQKIDEVGDKDNFVVRINNQNVSISSININSSDSKKLDIKLSSSFTSGDNIKVSYDPDNSDDGDPLISTDDVEAETFSNESASNSLNSSSVKAQSASLSSDGKTIKVIMSSNIDSSSVKKEYFSVNDSSISSVSSSGDTITININNAINGNAKVSYNSYYMKSSSGSKVLPFIINTSGSTSISGSWNKLPGGWQWIYSNGNIAKSNWIDAGNGTWYAFDDSGFMRTGWFLDNGIWYYLDPTIGNMRIGWVLINNKWYYFNMISNGTKGAMQTGWVYYNDRWYYLDPTNGDMKTGWIQYNGNSYYLDPINGDMYFNRTAVIDGNSYTFNNSGIKL